jgi:hypothetical protein
MTNPLQKYYRQPKIYISLPSKGNYYSEGSFDGDPENMPVFAMTGMDELIMKTPDALFNGEATVKLIESCCPFIKNAKEVPSIDIDVILAAIRMATFGETLSITHKCKNKDCESFNDYDINLQGFIDHYSSLKFNNKLELGELVVYFKPLNYGQLSKINIETFTLNQMLKQLQSSNNLEQYQEKIDEIYTQIGYNQVETFLESIDYIQTPDGIVNDREQIQDWVANCDREYYNSIKTHLTDIKSHWRPLEHDLECPECGQQDKTNIVLDQSHFFE